MSIYYIYQDFRKCTNCNECEDICNKENRLPEGLSLGRALTVKKNTKSFHVFLPCYNCEKPWCLISCPSGAIKKRKDDGIVYTDESLCIGCSSCITACPWAVPQWNKEEKKAVKCHLCKHRIDNGDKPACVEGCPANALSLVKYGG
ncbi:MAG: 4Fe-4S binding protein [Nitrospirae bacterium]|nr:4Fe-4S binding protein [Nitrospirota bacterium]